MRVLSTVIAAVLLSSAVSAAMSIEDLSPGKTVSGPNLTTKDMKNKVVLVMYWGTR
jgi:hypothetical protein